MSKDHIQDHISASTDKINKAGNKRHRRIRASSPGAKILIDGKELLDFCSNDYLGLANHPQIKSALIENINKYGAGSTASQLISGYTDVHHNLELKLTEFTGYERAVVFGNGYMANMAVVNALSDKNTLILGDRLNHASLVDAALMSAGKFKRFLHADPESLKNYINKENASRNILVLSDAVFSMDGDIAPLPEYVQICNDQGASIFIDDAHGFGVLGSEGKGTLEHFSLGTQDVPVMMATFGKALGTHGAFVASNYQVIEHLIQTARTLIYTTAPPPAWAAATASSLSILKDESWRREKLGELIKRFTTGARQLDLPLKQSITAIQPIIIGASSTTVRISEALSERGFFIPPIRPPTVPENTGRLRISLSAKHSPESIDRLLEAIKEIIGLIKPENYE